MQAATDRKLSQFVLEVVACQPAGCLNPHGCLMMFAGPFGTAKGQKTKPCSILFLVAWRSFHAIRTQGLHSNAGDEAHLSLITVSLWMSVALHGGCCATPQKRRACWQNGGSWQCFSMQLRVLDWPVIPFCKRSFNVKSACRPCINKQIALSWTIRTRQN